MKQITTWDEVFPGNVVQHKDSKILYLAVSDGTSVDGLRIKLVHRDNYIHEVDYVLPGHESEYLLVSTKPIKRWADLNHGDKVVCVDPRTEPGCVNAVWVANDNTSYLVSKEFMWDINQFYTLDWRVVESDCDIKIEGE